MVTMPWVLKGGPEGETSKCDQGRKALEVLQERHRLHTQERIPVSQCVHIAQYFPQKKGNDEL